MKFRPAAFHANRAAVAMVTAAWLAGAGCSSPKPPEMPSTQKTAGDFFGQVMHPYVPATRPMPPVTDDFPTAPQDAKPSVPLRYTVELWEILMPRDSVTTDDAFWKRVDESVSVDADRLQSNGIRVGELPASDLESVRKLIQDRGGKHSTINGVAGRQVELPVHENVTDQTVFYRDRADELVGRSWGNCDNLFFFSFETTPRDPDRLRLAFTPAVRSREKKLRYTIAPGQPDRELKEIVETSNYDVTVSADLSLDRLLVIAPSTEARLPHTIGGTFFVESTPSQQQERLILVIPHAYRQAEPGDTPGR